MRSQQLSKGTSHSSRASSMPIEVYDVKLLKEIELFDTNDFIYDEDRFYNDADDIDSGISELSFNEFKKTLNS